MTATLDPKPVIEMLHSVCDAGPNVIVVGVDGSHESRHALEWAVSHAKSHGLVIRVVTAYSTPHAAVDHPMSITILAVDSEKFARERAAAVVADVLGNDTAALAVEHVVRCGVIDRVLAEQVDDVAMFVVGTRRHRRWWDRFRSSATNRLTGQVDIPVMAIPCPADCPG